MQKFLAAQEESPTQSLLGLRKNTREKEGLGTFQLQHNRMRNGALATSK